MQRSRVFLDQIGKGFFLSVSVAALLILSGNPSDSAAATTSVRGDWQRVERMAVPAAQTANSTQGAQLRHPQRQSWVF